MKGDPKYSLLGNKLKELRVSAGIASQKEFATKLGAKPSALGRWERGLSRPTQNQMKQISEFLLVDVRELEALIKEDHATLVNVSFDQPFPIEALTPDGFERFCDFVIPLIYPGAHVNRYGGTGSKQDGLDIEAKLTDGKIYTFQCKRHKTFGAGKVKEAVKAHVRSSDVKVLLLTRIASSLAREEIAKHEDWELWDKEDISKKVRQIPRVDQIRLVDIFFPGQRFALLGETAAGPWMTIEDFFSAFLSRERAFNHLWKLVGREEAVEKLLSCVSNKSQRVTLLSGSGGLGKSRLLYEVINLYKSNDSKTLVKALSPTEELTSKHFEDLGSGEKVLIVDDAHDRDDLPILFAYLANPVNSARAVLSLRSYGVERVKRLAASAFLLPPYLSQLPLNPLSKAQSIELAVQVLEEYGGPVSAADQISKYTIDCPLATVIAAQIVAKEGLHPELLNTEELFRNTLLAKFQQVITGEIDEGKDQHLVRAILRVLSLVQPFNPDDQHLLDLMHEVEGISIPDGNRLVKALISGGIVFKRGHLYRLAPDLLADYIIEQSCVTGGGVSSGYAEKAFSACKPSMIENILLNLGKLDWRLSSGNPASSRLLDGLWNKIIPNNDSADLLHLKAITSVAYFQPERALQFAEMCIASGKPWRELPELIRYAAYNFEYVVRGSECLWELGKLDNRPLNQHPHHPIRILKELCTVEPNKPLDYIELVVGFGVSILDHPDSWSGKYSPFDFLEGVLQTEGNTTESNGREFSFSPYFVKQSAISSIRVQVINVAVERLLSPKTSNAVRAANFLSSSLRYPIGLFGAKVDDESYESWTNEFAQTLSAIKQLLVSKKLDDYVWLELLRSISWHATYAQDSTKLIAREIFQLAPAHIELRTIRIIFDRNHFILDKLSFEEKSNILERLVNDLAQEIISLHSAPEDGLAFISSILVKAENAKVQGYIWVEPLLRGIFLIDQRFAECLLENAIREESYVLSNYASVALSIIYHKEILKGRSFASQIIQSSFRNLRHSMAGCIAWQVKSIPENKIEIEFIRAFMASSHEEVKLIAPSLRSISLIDINTVIELVCSANFNNSPDVADEILSVFDDNHGLPIGSLGEDALDELLNKLIPISNIEGYWTQNFLSLVSVKYPFQTWNFLRSRVNFCISNNDMSYTPCNSGSFIQKSLRLRETEEFEYVLREIWVWLRNNSTREYYFDYYAFQLFEAIANPIDSEIVLFLSDKLNGDDTDILIIAEVFRHVPSLFVFDYYDFVIDYLTKARSHGVRYVDNAIESLYTSATTGLREGIPGEPFPKDLKCLEKSSAILVSLPRFSPAYKLYDQIKRYAENNIARSYRERAMFD